MTRARKLSRRPPDPLPPKTSPERKTAGTPGSNAPAHMDYRAHIVQRPVSELRESDVSLIRNVDALSEAATRLAACSGACIPVMVEADGTILAGEEFFRAYRDLGHDTVPVIVIDQLTTEQTRAFRVALRRMGQMTVFDEVVLASELSAILLTPDLIRMTPFSMAQVDQHLASAALFAAIPNHEDAQPDVCPVVVSQVDDLWCFVDGSRLLHGDSCDPTHLAQLFGDERADFVCADPPYGIAIANVSGHHGEFVQGSGVGEDEIGGLFQRFLGAMLPHLRDGCMVDTFTDHRSLFALMKELRAVGLEQKSLCTWDKETPGMGAPFRNVAEHIVISKFGTAPHIDNIQLGKHGRNRSTIWRAPGYAGFGRDRAAALERHATGKPVALIAEAILDFSHAGGIVYDAFIGSGTTLVAAHRTRRRCYGIELDGRFVDTAIKRMEAQTGETARHVNTGLTFAEVAAQRVTPPCPPVFRTRTRSAAIAANSTPQVSRTGMPRSRGEDV